MTPQVHPDPKPEARHKASPDEWVRITNVKMGPCRVCGATLSAWKMSLHHVLAKSLGGSDVEDNIVPLCGSGTTGCHGLIEAHDPTAGLKLRQSLTERELAFVAGLKGWDYLDRRYGGSGPLGEVARADDGAARGLTEREPQSASRLRPEAAVSEAVSHQQQPSSRSTHCSECGRRLPHDGPKEPARRKQSWRAAVPADSENGKEILDGLVGAARLELRPVLGFDPDVPAYFVLVAVLTDWLNGKAAAA